MRPGITIQHGRELSPESEIVRSDVVGFIGLVLKSRWPEGASRGDFIEMKLSGWSEFSDSHARRFVDPVTAQQVYQFFHNGGERCHVFGLFVEKEEDLHLGNPFDMVFEALLDRLRGEEDLGILVMPVLAYLPVLFERNKRVTVPHQPTIELLLGHCREMNNRFLILDVPRDLHEEHMLTWVEDLREAAGVDASYGAIYYPWLMNGEVSFPPSGSVAGIFARVESEHNPFGVRWPPANEVIRGVTHPAVAVRWRESDHLVEAHINPILTQPARGVVVWGARTLSRDPKWVYINARRIASLIAEQLRRDSEWVVFEHQRPELWETVERTVRSRLDLLWDAGLLTGDKAGLDYTVQCDAELNPPELRDAGQVNVRVMIRPISTAEFILVELRLG